MPIASVSSVQGDAEQSKMQVDDDSQLLDEQEAAEEIGMSVSYLQRDRCHGKTGNRTPGPPYYKIGRRVVYKRADLHVWLEQRRVDRPVRAGGNPHADKRCPD